MCGQVLQEQPTDHSYSRRLPAFTSTNDIAAKNRPAWQLMATAPADDDDVGFGVVGEKATSFANQWREVERIDVYVGGRLPSINNAVAPARGFCGSVSRANGALYRSMVHVQCARAASDGSPLRGRFVFVEVIAQPNRFSRVFTGVVCDVMVYQ